VTEFHRWFRRDPEEPIVFLAIGLDEAKDPVMKVSESDGRQFWDVELDLIERVEFVSSAKREGWSLEVEF
jgi:hypothetical protein